MRRPGFTLDNTTGEANGRVDFGGKPKVTARLALRELVLDPYLGGGAQSGPTNPSDASSDAGANSGAGGKATGWSTTPIDFSGLNAVDVDFKVTTDEIRWNKIKIDESALSATIQNGVLDANLEKLALYNGSGSGTVRLNGAATPSEVSAKFSLTGLNAYPLLRRCRRFRLDRGPGDDRPGYPFFRRQ